MTTAPLPAQRVQPPGCSGNSCPHPSSWPLHHVRPRNAFLRLCTSCVLKHHPGSFCPSCLELFDPQSPPPAAVVHCTRCPSLAHAACIASSSSPFLCPPCSSPTPSTFSFFPPAAGGPLDPHSARVLLAASRIALASMRRAAAASRAEAERKVRDSVLARRRARATLDCAAQLARQDHQSNDLTADAAKRKAAAAALADRGRRDAVRICAPKEEAEGKGALVVVGRNSNGNQDMPTSGGNALRSILGGTPSVASLRS